MHKRARLNGVVIHAVPPGSTYDTTKVFQIIVIGGTVTATLTPEEGDALTDVGIADTAQVDGPFKSVVNDGASAGTILAYV